jgi:hypothetical protein
MKPKTNPSVKKLVEDNRLPEPENSPALYIDDLVTHYDFAQFLKNLGFIHDWTSRYCKDEGIIYTTTYDWRKHIRSDTNRIERIFIIDISTLNGIGPSHELVYIFASCELVRYSISEGGLKFEVNYSAFIPPAIPNSVYVDYTVKDFVLNVIAMMKKIVPGQSDEESSKLLKAIEHQFKEIDQSQNKNTNENH